MELAVWLVRGLCSRVPNLYDRSYESEPTELMFIPAMNGKNGRDPVKVKQFHYPEEYKNLEEKASEHDFAVLEL